MFNSFRDYDYTSEHGYVSCGGFTFQNYLNAWEQGDFARHFLNTVYITVPAVLLTLFLASCVAFVSPASAGVQPDLARALHGGQPAAPAGDAHPAVPALPRVPLPLWMSDSGKLLDSFWGLILIHVAFQSGFCTFVLSNYMKVLPN